MGTEPLLILADALWNGLAETAERPGRLLIDGGRVVATGHGAHAADGIRQVELAGCTLLPGLIDMHGHCRIDARLGPLQPQTRDEPAHYLLQSLRNLQVDLAAGVTTVKTNGDRDLLDVGLRDAIAAGEAEGPRLVVAGRGIKAPNCPAGVVATAFCRGSEQIRAAVRANLSAGADHVKIYVSGGLLEPVQAACRAYYSLEEIRAAVEAAEESGSYVSAHCAGGPAADWCAEAGVRVLEHGFYLEDDQLAHLRDSGTWLDFTLGVAFHPEGHAAELVRRGASMASLQQREELARGTIRRAIAAGNRFVLGTDSMHGLLAYEAEQVVSLGARPLDALRALTARAASVIGKSIDLGTLDPGKLGDLLAVKGDPLRDISALWSVAGVWKEGRRVASG